MTDPHPDEAAMRDVVRGLFGPPQDAPIDLGQPTQKTTSHIIPSEGGNPGPGPISDDAHLRDFTRRVFDADYAFYQQELPE